MRSGQGVQTEVLISLALVMVTATALLVVIFLETHHARIEALHDLLGRGFVAESQRPEFAVRGFDGGSVGRIDSAGEPAALGPESVVLDEQTRALGREAIERARTLVQSGAPWQPIRFATPDTEGGGAFVGRIEAPLPGVALSALVLIDVSIFGLFGVTLLRRKIVGPLHRLAGAVREMRDGELAASVPVDGVGEIAELGAAFNEMQEALAARTGALEKAVSDLRGANARLLQAREGLDRAERLAMVGSMAAGVAHEVGNPMGAMLAFLDVASRDSGLGDEGKRCLARASEQGERVRMILRQLLDFSRAPQVQQVPISLEETLRQVRELITAQPEYAGIQFEIESEEGVPRAVGDPSLTSQVLLNLLLNAADAMEGVEQRAIRIHLGGGPAQRRGGDGDEAEQAWRQRQVADAVVCTIEDAGPGVAVEDPERIFDPFFTTKDPGKGTGLGLANARRLAEEMGGQLELDEARSDLGGARFRFVLRAEGAKAAPEEGAYRETREPGDAKIRDGFRG